MNNVQYRMLSMKEAFELLKSEEVTVSIQVLRRWIREGKIPGAYMKDKKHGYLIPGSSLLKFVKNYKSNKVQKRDKTDYKKGYEDGYEDGRKESIEREKQLISRFPSVFETQHMVLRTDVRERAKSIFSYPEERKGFLKFLDDSIFLNQVTTLKNRIYINQLGKWLLLENTRELFSLEDLQLDENYDFKERFLDMLLDKKRKEYIKGMVETVES